MRLLGFLLALLATSAQGAPTNAQTYAAQHADAFRNGTPGMIMAKGSTDNNSYMLETDTTNGGLLVDIVGGSLTLGYDTNYGTVGANTLRTAAQIGNATGAAAFGAGTTSAQTLRVVIPTDQTAVPVSAASLPLPTGAATEASLVKLPLAQGSTTSGQSGALVQGAVTTSAPSYTTAQTSPLSLTTGGALRVDASGSTQPVSGTVAATQSGTWTVQPGNTANTTAWLTHNTGGAYADSVRNDYTSTNVTTGAWVQLIASTAAVINCITVFDSSGQTLKLGTGAAASETIALIIPPGGLGGCIPLKIAAGTRLSIRAISATASTGELDVTGLQ